jgi:DNA polymerase-4
MVPPEGAVEFLAPLPAGKLWGVGPKTAARLEADGLRTIGDVAAAPIDRLRRLLGAWGDVAHELARGIDDRAVEPVREAKSVSSERTFPRDLHALRDMRTALRELSREVARRLRAEGSRARTVALKVRFADFRTITRQTRLSEAADEPEVLRRTACGLLDGVERGGVGVRLLGIRASNLEHGAGQLSLFDRGAQRRAQLEKTLAYLRRRYGPDAVKWARETQQ